MATRAARGGNLPHIRRWLLIVWRTGQNTRPHIHHKIGPFLHSFAPTAVSSTQHTDLELFLGKWSTNLKVFFLTLFERRWKGILEGVFPLVLAELSPSSLSKGQTKSTLFGPFPFLWKGTQEHWFWVIWGARLSDNKARHLLSIAWMTPGHLEWDRKLWISRDRNGLWVAGYIF